MSKELMMLNGGTVKWHNGNLRMTFPGGSFLETDNFTTVLLFEFLLRFIENDNRPTEGKKT